MNVTVRDVVPARSQPTDVDVFFVAGLAEKGPATPVLIHSMSEFTTNFGDRVSYGDLYDMLDAYFREGGSRAYVARVVGDAPVRATVVLDDASSADTVAVTATSPGDWANSINVAVVAGTGGARHFVITNDDGDTLEVSPDFLNKTDMLGWDSSYVDITSAGPSTDMPAVVGTTSLAGGDDDRDTVDDTSYEDILDNFNKDLGPGQIALPGKLSAAVQGALLEHAYTNNRVALLDAPDSGTASTLTAAATTLTANPYSRYGGMFGPKAIIPGITPGTTREMWWSVIQAAMIARMLNPNDPAAGVNGMSRLALRSKYTYSDTDRETLNNAGVNIAREMYGGVRTYGYRTLASPVTLPQWVQLNAIRTIMAIKAEADSVAESYVFAQIDGRGISISSFGGALSAMLAKYYEEGALYGRTPQEAFAVDTGSQVNTPASIADGQLKANILVRTSPFGEMVNIDIIKMPLPSTTAASPLSAS